MFDHRDMFNVPVCLHITLPLSDYAHGRSVHLRTAVDNVHYSCV